MILLFIGLAGGLLVGWFLPPPWHRRTKAKARAGGRAQAHAELRVPSEQEISDAIERGARDHQLHEDGHHQKYPGHVAEEAIRQRARNEFAAAGFTFVPIDLHARVKKARR